MVFVCIILAMGPLRTSHVGPGQTLLSAHPGGSMGTLAERRRKKGTLPVRCTRHTGRKTSGARASRISDLQRSEVVKREDASRPDHVRSMEPGIVTG